MSDDRWGLEKRWGNWYDSGVKAKQRCAWWRFSLWLAALVCGVPAADGQIMLYVAPDGNDAGTGTAASPWRTVERARDYVRSNRLSITSDVIVELAGGVYRIEKPIRFGSCDALATNLTVTYRAAAGEQPVISGARVVDAWTIDPGDTNLWRSMLPAGTRGRQFFAEDRRAVRARGPAPRGETHLAATNIMVQGLYTSDTNFPAWPDVAGAEIVLEKMWTNPRFPIVGATNTADGRVFLEMGYPGWLFRTNWLREAHWAWTENARALLDEPGEWYLDRTASELLYRPLDPAGAGSITGRLPVVETLVFIEGDTNAPPAGGLRFEGITFADTTWLWPDSGYGYGELQTGVLSYWSTTYRFHPPRLMGAAVHVRRAANVAFERCTFTRLGGAALNVYAGVAGLRIQGCLFDNMAGGGVQVGEPDFSADDTAVNYNPRRAADRIEDVVIADNVFRAMGLEYQSVAGVYVSYARGVEILHNEFRDMPYSAIAVGWGWGGIDPTYGGGHRIEGNSVRGALQELKDGAGIYLLAANEGTSVVRNFLRGFRHSQGCLYFDSGASGITAGANVLADALRWAFLGGVGSSGNTLVSNITSIAWLHGSEGPTNVFRANRMCDRGMWTGQALDVIAASGPREGWHALVEPDVEWIQPRPWSGVLRGQTVDLAVRVFADTAAVDRVVFNVNGTTVGEDADANDGWRTAWTPLAAGSASCGAEVWFRDGTSVESESAAVYVSGLDAGTAVAQPAAGAGPLAIEAEAFWRVWRHDHAVLRRHWALAAEPAGFEGTGGIQAAPDIGMDGIDFYRDPRVEYLVQFDRPATNHVWLRMHGDADSNYLHAGVDGWIADSYFMHVEEGQTWFWSRNKGDPFVVDAAGLHSIGLALRHTGLVIDRIVLSEDPDYVPDGIGPAASPAVAVSRVPETVLITDANDAAVERSTRPGLFYLMRSGPDVSQPLTVNIGVDASRSTAVEGVDFAALPRTVTIPAGATGVQLPVWAIEDYVLDEPSKSLWVRLFAGEGYVPGQPAVDFFVRVLDAEHGSLGRWRRHFFASPWAAEAAAGEDADGDGLRNFEERMLARDPRVFDDLRADPPWQWSVRRNGVQDELVVRMKLDNQLRRQEYGYYLAAADDLKNGRWEALDGTWWRVVDTLEFESPLWAGQSEYNLIEGAVPLPVIPTQTFYRVVFTNYGDAAN